MLFMLKEKPAHAPSPTLKTPPTEVMHLKLTRKRFLLRRLQMSA